MVNLYAFIYLFAYDFEFEMKKFNEIITTLNGIGVLGLPIELFIRMFPELKNTITDQMQFQLIGLISSCRIFLCIAICVFVCAGGLVVHMYLVERFVYIYRVSPDICNLCG